MVNKLNQIIDAHSGKLSDKWSIYISEYEKLFKDFMDKEINYLEIGVQNGGFLEIVSKYFEKAKIILGIDINPDCEKLIFEDSRISVIVGDANDKKIISDIESKNLTFDIIVDDGSHTSRDIILAFSNFFPNLKNEGFYIVEDLHCTYWQEFQGGLYDHTSSLSFFKKLIDIINNEHWGIEKSSREFLEYFENKYNIELNYDCFKEIHSIEFINSLCIIKKNNSSHNILGKRRVSGIHEIVEGHLALYGAINGMNPIALNQEFNPTSKRILEVEDEVVILKNKINQDTLIIQELQKGIASRDQSIQQLQEGIASRDQSIQQLQEGIDTRDQQIEVLTNSISNIYQSTSWKLSYPIRLAGHQLKRFKIIYNALLKILSRGGGFRKSLSKAFKVYKNGGIGQVRSTLRLLINSPLGNSIALENGEIVDRNDYQEWIKRFDTLTPEICAKIQNEILEFENPPKISIVMPVYDPPIQFLDEAIWSVRNQLYQNWELCIADDCSKNEEVRVLLRKHASEEARIKVVYRQENGHISRASNSALDLATGEFVGFLDHDDLIREHTLFHFAKVITQNPEVMLIYSDEDKINHQEKRQEPYFKCNFNYDLFLSQNMICHFGVFKTELVKNIGGFRNGFEGSQDYDLTLRYIEKISKNQIFHIPRVLYHWRAHPQSTASSISTKNYALISGEKALNDHFQRSKILAKAEILEFGMYRVWYTLPKVSPLITLIIPTRNGLNLIKQCIDSILNKTTYDNFEILIVDNNSDDHETVKYLRDLDSNPLINVILDKSPFNFSAINNRAVSLAKGEFIALINNDIEVLTPDWLEEMVSIAIQPGVGAVGAKLLYPNDTLQHGGVVLGIGGVAGHSHKNLPRESKGYFSRAQLIQSFSAVTAACLVVKKEFYLKINGLDEVNLTVAFNDVDFCLRLEDAGYRNVWTPFAELYHHESASRGYEDTPEKQERFMKEVLYMKEKWRGRLLNDPSYSPILTFDREDFSLAFPPRIDMV